MSVINITCPGCGITLEADEKYLGSKVACTECEHEFTLWTPEESLPYYPDMLEEFKPGIVAKAGLPLSFQSPLFTHEQLAIALSEEDSKRIFHFSYPLLRSVEEGVNVDGYRRYWIETIDIRGESYVMFSQWFDYNRKLLIQWLRQMEVDYSDLKDACNILRQGEVTTVPDEQNTALRDFDELSDSNQENSPSIGKINFETPINCFNFCPAEIAALQNQEIKNVKDLLGLNLRKYSHAMGIGAKKVKTMKGLIEKLKKDLGVPDDSNADENIIIKDEGEYYFSFDAPVLNLAHTKPYLLEICGERIAIRSWSDLIVAVASFCFRTNSEKMECLVMNRHHPFSIMRKRVCIAKSETHFIHGKKIADNFWIETNFSSQKCVVFAVELADYAAIPKERIRVCFASVGTLLPNTNCLAPDNFSSEKYLNQTIQENVPEITPSAFTKGLDWSSLTTGVTIPTKFHEIFLAHLQTSLQPGDSYPVFISVQGKDFRVAINNISFTDPNHSRCLMFFWSRKSPMALMLQATFSEAFALLRDNRANKCEITDTLTVSCGDEKDHFTMELAKSMVIPDTPDDEDDISKSTSPLESVSPEFQEFADKCAVLLDESFSSGFRLNSPIAVKRFRSFWEDKFSSECDREDDDIQKAMKLVGVEFEERIYSPCQLASQEVIDELKEYVKHLFAEGKPVIYYQALFDEFNRRGTDWKINSPEMLKSFLSAQECPWSLRRFCIAIDHDVAVSPITEIRNYLREQQEPVGYGKLYAVLPHLPQDVIKRELANNTEFVNTARGEYMHADIVDLSASDLELIAGIIQTEIHSKGYMTGIELWEKLEVEFPEYTNRYSHLPLVGFRDALKHKFSGQFNFQGNIISSVDEPIRMADIFAGFCKRRSSFTLADLDRLRVDADAPVIYFEPVYENSIRISQDDFVSPESVSFDVDAVDEAISRFCNGEFIAIADITSFAAFPAMGVQWTSYLVEAFVSKYSKKYKLLHNQYNATVCAGAILRADAKLYDYNQVLAVALAKAKCELDSATALDYLCDAGFLGRHRYKDIDNVLSEARQIRSGKR